MELVSGALTEGYYFDYKDYFAIFSRERTIQLANFWTIVFFWIIYFFVVFSFTVLWDIQVNNTEYVSPLFTANEVNLQLSLILFFHQNLVCSNRQHSGLG